jgi:hypothetical protein
LFVATLHPRVDLRDVLFTFGFSFKLIVALALVVTTAAVLADVARPVAGFRRYRGLLLAPALLAVAVVAELSLTPGRFWLQRLTGYDASHCLTLIPMLSVAPASCLLIALKHGAPRHPALAGAIAGLLAGGVGAALYALTCPNDSPLFVATWYSTAMALVTSACAWTGHRFLRW